jgi:Galactose-1-phosphate uridylyltransferase
MPEYRHDAILDRRVIVAAERSARPYTTAVNPDLRTGPDACPFCEGHEDRTPPETYRTGDGEPDTTGWRVRVVPNLYPIVGAPETGDATGAHEVVILSPDHDRGFAQLERDQAVEALTVVRDRARVHLAAGRAYVSAFINHGRGAGASIEHPHAQLVAPDAPSNAVSAMTARFSTDLIAREMADARRTELVVVDGPAIAWCPPASWSPYLLRVAHRSTRARFDEATDAEIRVVADALHGALGRIDAVLGNVPYNVVVHGAPPAVRAAEMHWHLEVVPRTSVVAGFEIGSGIYANSVAPEQAAGFLRGD